VTRYAAGTTVDVSSSRVELEKTLKRFGAAAFGYMQDDDLGTQQVAFRLAGRQVRIDVPMPDADEYALTPTGKRRTDTAAREAYEQEVRRRWRALNLVTKAKLTAVAEGISTLEREFLADMVTDDGRTVGQRMARSLAAGGTVLALGPGS
jgi:hypothetical protein